MANWDQGLRDKYRSTAQLVIGLVLGAVVLLPSIVGLSHPPYMYKCLVPLALGLCAISTVLLGVVVTCALIGTKSAPIRLSGLGNWTALAALLALVIYVLVNVREDYTSKPAIVSVKTSPKQVVAGSYIEFEVDAQDQDSDRLKYVWNYGNKAFSTFRTAYLKAPDKAGVYEVTISVTDDSNTVDAKIGFEVIGREQSSQKKIDGSADNPESGGRKNDRRRNVNGKPKRQASKVTNNCRN